MTILAIFWGSLYSDDNDAPVCQVLRGNIKPTSITRTKIIRRLRNPDTTNREVPDHKSTHADRLAVSIRPNRQLAPIDASCANAKLVQANVLEQHVFVVRQGHDPHQVPSYTLSADISECRVAHSPWQVCRVRLRLQMLVYLVRADDAWVGPVAAVVHMDHVNAVYEYVLHVARRPAILDDWRCFCLPHNWSMDG